MPQTPVSAAIAFDAQTTCLQHALDLIDQVHSDGALPVIAISELPADDGRLGIFSLDEPIIQISAPSKNTFAFVHEIGHLIDHKGLGANNFASKNYKNNELSGWFNAVEKSQTYKLLHHNYSGNTGLRGVVKYLLQPEELWARCYSQWIATKTLDQTLLNELWKYQNSNNFITKSFHWSDDEFRPIARKIETLFSAKGWI